MFIGAKDCSFQSSHLVMDYCTLSRSSPCSFLFWCSSITAAVPAIWGHVVFLLARHVFHPVISHNKDPFVHIMGCLGKGTTLLTLADRSRSALAPASAPRGELALFGAMLMIRPGQVRDLPASGICTRDHQKCWTWVQKVISFRSLSCFT